MPVAFGQIPPDVLLPLFYAEVTSAAEPWSPALKVCLVGSANQGAGYGEGSHVPNQPYLLSGTLAKELFGRGSMLARMYDFARSNAPFAEIWGCAIPSTLDDPDPLNNAFRATAKVRVIRGGTATFFGTGTFHIEGIPVHFNVQKNWSAATIAASIRNAVNSRQIGMLATIDPKDTSHQTVLLTARYPGNVGNWLKVSYVGCFGRADNSAKNIIIAKHCLQITKQTSDGSGEHSPTACFSTIQDRPFDVFIMGYQSPHFLMACEDFMDHAAGRWAPNRQLYGHIFTGLNQASWQATYDYLSVQQDPHMSIITVKNTVIPYWLWASALGGLAATHWSAPPELSRPLQTLELRNCCAGSDDDESFTRIEKQTLLNQGGSTITVDDNHTCRIDRVRTLRKYNVYGDPDPSWADAITMFQAQFFVRQMRARIQGAYPRCALSTLPSGINGFTSPIEIRNLIIHEYKRLSGMGLVENVDLFTRYLVCERNPTDRNRVDVLMRPDFVNQLRVVAALVETHLELDATDPTLLQVAA